MTSENNLPRKSIQIKSNQNQNEKISETFNLSDYKACNKCTYFQYGDIVIEQYAYNCEICDPNKVEFICMECYYNCHKACRNEEEEPPPNQNNKDKNNDQPKSKFFCECGFKKHQIEKQKDQELIKACLFWEVDLSMGLKINNYCKNDKIYLCSICAKECHKKRGCDVQKEKMRYFNNYDKNQKDNLCQCKAPKHSNKNSMIRLINKIIDKEEYGDFHNIWRLQLFNYFCNTQIFNSLFNETQILINNYNLSTPLRRDYFNLCDKFTRLGKLIMNSQKYYYFKPSYVNLIN